MRVLGRVLGGVGMLCAFVASVQAAGLTIGTRAELVMDPHHQWNVTNVAYYRQIYGTLTALDENAQARPMLADYRLVNDWTWEFKIRPNATFHNGKPVQAADVVASLHRARTLPNAAASFVGAFQTITDVKATSAQTVLITTERPNGNIAQQLTQIAIVPKEVAETASREDFTSGRAAIGAGPYRVLRYLPGDRLELARFDEAVGPRPHWESVTYRFIPDDSARVAALMRGEVDLIDFVPTDELERLRQDRRLAVHTRLSDRVMFLIPDAERDKSPFVADAEGKPLGQNPLRHARVRKAMSLAIDREALVSGLFNTAAKPANQLVPKGFEGYNGALPMASYDLEQAKRLLLEAGYPKGFQLTIHCTNDRYVNDARLCQAIGQMLTRLGLKMNVVTQSKAIFFGQMTKHDGERASLMMIGWGNGWTGDASGVLMQVVHSYDKARNAGGWNLGHYSNPMADNLIQTSTIILDRARKSRFQQVAMQVAMEDSAQIPLVALQVITASRREITYTPFADESTLATEARPNDNSAVTHAKSK